MLKGGKCYGETEQGVKDAKVAEERGTTVGRGVRAGHTERVVFEQKREGGKEVRREDIWGRAFLTEGRARRETLRWEVACGAEEQRGGQWDWSQGSMWG